MCSALCGAQYFKDFVHIPISHKSAYYDLYMAIHKNTSNHQRMLANKFSQIFRRIPIKNTSDTF